MRDPRCNPLRNPAHNLLLCRRVICLQCRAQSAALPPCKLCAMPRTTCCPMQPLKSYNRMQMQLASSHAFPEPLLAAMPQLREKPHLGLSSKNPALHQVHEVCNSTTALGFRAALHLERIRSRYTGKERDTESGNDYFSARYYASSMGRFMSPDPMGGHYENPQTLNKYAYVINNPLTMTDPTGLDIWLKGCGDNSATCQNNYAGTTDKDGAFSRTHLTGDQTGDATLGAHGISVTVGSGDSAKTYAGVWDTNKGEGGTVTVAGAGALSGYKADVTGNCGGTCVASGSITSMNPNSGNITKALFGVLDTKSSGYVKNAGTDAMNFFHPGATNFRGHASGDPSGMPSTHIPIDPKASLPNNEWHVDGSFPYDGVKDWLTHAGCATGASCDPTK